MEGWLEEAFENIDAGVFSGDTFLNPDNVAELKNYMGRWERNVEGLNRPKVGVSVFVFHPTEKAILMGIRMGAHGEGTWALPGGHLEYGEHWLETAVRETKEETGLELLHPRFLTISNVIMKDESRHYVDLNAMGVAKTADFVLLEPEKCKGWEWVHIDYVRTKKPLFPVLEEVLKTVDLKDISMLNDLLNK